MKPLFYFFVSFLVVTFLFSSCVKDIDSIKDIDNGSSPALRQSATADCPLCIGFSSVNVVPLGCDLTVSWTHQSPDSKVFEIERSSDAVNFSVIATVNGNSGQNSYTYTTRRYNIVQYFRLVAKDPAGNKEYSSIVSASASANCPTVFASAGGVDMNILGLHIREVVPLPVPGQSVVFKPSGTPFLITNQVIYSANNRFRLVLQGDGNLVVYNNSTNTSLWGSNSMGTNRYGVWFQYDANLVIYTNSNATGSAWGSNTSSTNQGTFNGLKVSDVCLVFQNDGNLILALPESASGLMGVIAATEGVETTPSSHQGSLQ